MFKTAIQGPDADRGLVSWARGSGRAWGRRAVLLAMAFYLAVLAWVYWQQEQLIFQPDPLAAAHRLASDNVHEVAVNVDGAELSALHLRLPNPKGVIFFLHGSTGNLASWFANADFCRRANYDPFMLDYRGYGKSEGRIESEAQLPADALAAWRSVARRCNGKRKVDYGRSLGAALAAGLAAGVEPDLIILVSPFCSLRELMDIHYPLLPHALLRYPMDTCADVARLRATVLLLHGEEDSTVPISHSERLLALAPQGRLVRIPGAAHADVHRFHAYSDEIFRTLRSL